MSTEGAVDKHISHLLGLCVQQSLIEPEQALNHGWEADADFLRELEKDEQPTSESDGFGIIQIVDHDPV